MIDTCVTPKNKMEFISNLRTRLFTLIATMSAECVFRFSNFKIRGTFHSSVPLLPVQARLTNGAHADKVTPSVCVLLSHIGIKLVKGNFTNKARSIYNQCARKRFKHSNCCVRINVL